MARLGPLLLKGAGALLLAFIVLSVIAAVVSIVLSIVATVVAAAVTLAILAVVVLAVVGLASLFRDDEATVDAAYRNERPNRSTEKEAPADRLRSQYVDGKLSEDEFERELDRLLEDDPGRADGFGRERSSARESTDRTRLRDR
ncbi:SHOCT domain-containing protein [Natronorubrum sp. DTA28]|uniref:SHOCT domain-containing protein n=1 Tax=Natronorubrum sp. DTA28 TaxID=3447019 RepID=UPI003F85C991